jgi:hypothetical protein
MMHTVHREAGKSTSRAVASLHRKSRDEAVPLLKVVAEPDGLRAGHVRSAITGSLQIHWQSPLTESKARRHTACQFHRRFLLPNLVFG